MYLFIGFKVGGRESLYALFQCSLITAVLRNDKRGQMICGCFVCNANDCDLRNTVYCLQLFLQQFREHLVINVIFKADDHVLDSARDSQKPVLRD